jgi:hypothetical protein
MRLLSDGQLAFSADEESHVIECVIQHVRRSGTAEVDALPKAVRVDMKRRAHISLTDQRAI